MPPENDPLKFIFPRFNQPFRHTRTPRKMKKRQRRWWIEFKRKQKLWERSACRPMLERIKEQSP